MYDRNTVIVIGLTSLVSLGCGEAVITPEKAELLLSASPASWYENALDHAEPGLAPRVIYGGEAPFIHAQGARYRTGAPVDAPLPGNQSVRNVLRGPNGLAVVLVQDSTGKKRWSAADLRVHRWVEDRRKPAHIESIPDNALPAWSPDGLRVAFRSLSDANDLTVLRQDGSPLAVGTDGPVVDYAWRVGTPELVILVDRGDGSYSVVLGDADTGSTTTLVAAMDGVPRAVGAGLTVAADGSYAIVSAVQKGAPSPRERLRHSTDRDLDLFRIDLNSGDVRPLGGTEADDHHPRLAPDGLYWTSTSIQTDVVLIPATGGEPRVIAQGAQGPSWHPDENRLGFVVGEFREADWTHNFDGAAVDLSAAMEPIGSSDILLANDGGDFTPVWSPNGKWLAYRRAEAGPSLLSAPTPSAPAPPDPSINDIFLRSLSSPETHGEDRQVTEWGRKMSSPVWSPTSTQLVLTARTALDSTGAIVPSALDRAWVLDLDPEDGNLTSATLLALPRGVEEIKAVAWAPDGRIAVEAQEADSIHAIWTMTPGRGAGRVTAYIMDTDGGIAWLPTPGEEDRLVLSARREGSMGLFSIEASGRGIRQLSPEGRNLFQPAVSPSGSWIAATEIRVLKQVWRTTLP